MEEIKKEERIKRNKEESQFLEFFFNLAKDTIGNNKHVNMINSFSVFGENIFGGYSIHNVSLLLTTTVHSVENRDPRISEHYNIIPDIFIFVKDKNKTVPTYKMSIFECKDLYPFTVPASLAKYILCDYREPKAKLQS